MSLTSSLELDSGAVKRLEGWFSAILVVFSGASISLVFWMIRQVLLIHR